VQFAWGSRAHISESATAWALARHEHIQCYGCPVWKSGLGHRVTRADEGDRFGSRYCHL